MRINKIVVRNYKILKEIVIELNPKINIFVGDNDAGKSTILEVLSIITTGKLNGYAWDRQMKATLFNCDIREKYIAEVTSGKKPAPPRIIMEAYFDGDSRYKGTNNEFSENTPGIRVMAGISDDNTEVYRHMLANGEVKDIPIELYDVSYHYFSGEIVNFRTSPFKSVFIDTTRKGYSGVIDHFVSNSITDNLTDEDIRNLALAYKSSRIQFHEHEVVKKLNETVKSNDIVKGHDISLDLREDDVESWKRQMAVVVDSIPFENIGFGTQNIIKIELAMRNAENQANIVLLEEPENNLSFSNMAQLVNHVVKSNEKQVFISTHNSYIANKLDLGNVILVKEGKVKQYSSLPEETKKYFIKLPRYDTLRFVLASKVILVEGATDDLIIQRAYKDKTGHLPADDGIDIITVEALAFKRFADIANLIGKEIVIVTDNDGNIKENIKEKYRGYIGRDNLTFIYESNDNLNTIEPSVLNANCVDGQPTENFKKAISKNGSLESRDYDGILNFMEGNKTEWAFRIFESELSICYPEYIENVIAYFK